jgi:hypothetical protein
MAACVVPQRSQAQTLRFALGDDDLQGGITASYADTAARSLEDTAAGAHLNDDEAALRTSVDLQTTQDSLEASQDAGYVGYDSKGCTGSKGCNDPGCGCSLRWPLLSRFFGGVEYTHWYSQNRSTPALVTTSPQGTPALLARRLNPPPGFTTTVLIGDDRIGGDLQAGGRINVGFWLDDEQRRAIGVRLYGSEGESQSFAASSTGDPILARPFFDTNPLVNDDAAFLVAYPGLAVGSVNATASNDVLGGEIYGRILFDYGCNYRLDLMGGYQFNRIDDDLMVTSVTTTPQPITTTLVDLFDVSNEFHAAELGLIGEIYHGCWTISMLGKIAVGNMRQEAAISGDFTVAGGASPGSGPGGLLAQPTNIGVFERDLVTWSPEASVLVSYALTDQLSMSVGYTFLYWTRVALAGDLLDPNLNSAQITNGNNPFAGPQDPGFAWQDNDFWIQTVDVGLSFRY